MISELPRARPLWRTGGSRHQKSCGCERHQLGRAVSSGTLRNIVLKQRQGPCLQTIALMKKLLSPPPTTLLSLHQLSADRKYQIPSQHLSRVWLTGRVQSHCTGYQLQIPGPPKA